MIAEDSNLMHQDNLAHFQMPPTQAAVEKTHYIKYKPKEPLANRGPLHYHIPGNSSQYVDLYNTRHCLKVKVERADGEPLDDTDDVTLANNPIHTLFSDVKVRLQQQEVGTCLAGTYPYKADIETKLRDATSANAKLLTQGLYIPDQAGHMNDTTKGGLFLRKDYIKKSKVLQLEGRVHSDVMNQKKLILPGVDVQLEFVPSSPEFALIWAPKEEGTRYRFSIVDAWLKVCKMSLAPAVMLAEAEVMQKKNAKFPYRSTKMKWYTFGKDTKSICMDDLFQSRVPDTMVVAMVNGSAMSGNHLKNPLDYQHNKLTYASCRVDGQAVPGEAIVTDFQTGEVMEAYGTIFDAFDNQDVSISRDDYVKGGYTLICFKVNPSASRDFSYMSPIKHGNVQLELRLKENLEETTNVLIYAAFPEVFEIDSARNVIL